MTSLPGALPEAPDRDLAAYRRVALGVAFAFAVLSPALSVLHDPHVSSAARWFLVTGSLAFVGATLALIAIQGAPGAAHKVPWPALGLILALAVGLIAVGQANWVAVLAIAPAACGRYSRSRLPAVVGSTVCTGAGLGVALTQDAAFGSVVAAVALPAMAGFFSYAAGRRLDAVDALRRTRADLARAAVAEERLRIARDVHDLLGHSLSLITLKAQLAGRTMGSDPERAAREIAELEAVARRSLSEVREAVAGYRQPDLAGELSAARQLLESAGITAAISSPDISCLSRDVDSALAWAIREGTTNVVRHSRATQVAISVSAGESAVVAEIRDNGPAAAGDLGPAARQSRPAGGGSGLAGLRERIRALGGELAAGAVQPRGFRLRVEVPLAQQAA